MSNKDRKTLSSLSGLAPEEATLTFEPAALESTHQDGAADIVLP